MTVFLAIKQWVDMLYQYQFLDYIMVIWVFIMLGNQLRKYCKGRSLKENLQRGIKCINPADLGILVLMLLYVLSFLRHPDAKSQFLKAESILLLYFLGRSYGAYEPAQVPRWQRITLIISCYGILYSNLIYRLYSLYMAKHTGIDNIVEAFGVENGGALFYYKTDLAIGVIYSLILLVVFLRPKKYLWVKWLTILPVSIFLIFGCKARIGQGLFILEALLFAAILLMKHRKRKGKLSSDQQREAVEAENKKPASAAIWVVTILVALLLTGVFTFVQASPLFEKDYQTYQENMTPEQMWNLEQLFHARHIIWWDTLHYMQEQSFGTRLMGIDLATDHQHNMMNFRLHNQYFKTWYSIGYLGCYISILLLGQLCQCFYRARKQEKNAVICYLCLAIGLLFLFMGISAETMETTQFGWLPLLFIGMMVSRSENNIN